MIAHMEAAHQIPHTLYRVRLPLQKKLSGEVAQNVACAFDEERYSVFLHNKDATDGDDWTITLTTRFYPDREVIYQALLENGTLSPLDAWLEKDKIIAEPVEEQDWLLQVHADFPPFSIGKFFIYGSHYTADPPPGTIPLKIDAATAFGSGEHETTRGCLQMLEKLSEVSAFKNVLDMGAGSGILAIAAAKLWPEARMTAVDIDPEAVLVTQRHAGMNATPGIRVVAGDGYAAPVVAENGPFDLIVANILSGPLIDMAPALAAHLEKGGYAILSGLLKRQKEDVAQAHRAVRLRLCETLEVNDWAVLVLRRGPD